MSKVARKQRSPYNGAGHSMMITEVMLSQDAEMVANVPWGTLFWKHFDNRACLTSIELYRGSLYMYIA